MDFDADLRSLTATAPLTRRRFVVTALAAGFATAVRPIAAQTAISTSAEGLRAGEVRIPVPDGAIPAYRAMPGQGETELFRSSGRPSSLYPVVLVVQEIFGVHEHIRDVCRRLAKLGYLAVAPELYARQGDVSKIKSVDEIMETVVARVPDAQVLSDLDATAAWAGQNGGDARRLGITGFCWGGRIVWLYAAHNPRLKAGVAWYGRPTGDTDELRPKQPIDLAASLKAPVLGLYGGADQGIPLDVVEIMKDELNDAKSASRIVVYPGAPHGFHADFRSSYRKEAAEDGWRRLQQWFRQHGVA